VVLPVEDQAAEQLRPAQEGAFRRRRPAQGHVVTAARAGVAAVEHELLRAQPAGPCLLVDGVNDFVQFRPVAGRVDVDLDDAGVRRDLQDVQARVPGRLVAFEYHRDGGIFCCFFHRADKIEVGLQMGRWRHEDVNMPVPWLYAEGGMDDLAIVTVLRRRGFFLFPAVCLR